MNRPRLALFDCDGTLADSQHDIVAAMTVAFVRCGLTPPPAQDVRTSIGLSVTQAVMQLAPQLDDDALEQLGDAYRDAYFEHRSQSGTAPEPLYEGIVGALDRLLADGWLLGVATGKSQRGLVRLLTAHGIIDRFVTLQTADTHPSKPHPSMCFAAIAQAGVLAEDTVVIGDTGFDMMMAAQAGSHALGVAWGYHPVAELQRAGAAAIADAPAALPEMLNALMEIAR